jgi:hypothetical protein
MEVFALDLAVGSDEWLAVRLDLLSRIGALLSGPATAGPAHCPAQDEAVAEIAKAQVQRR